MRQNCSYTSPSSARYYNSALSIWLSVDPMSDKYPGVSPYVYCGNNPVRLVDPDGRDIWEIDENGKIVNQYENKDVDRFYIVDLKGNHIAESESYKAGTFDVIANETGMTIFNVNENSDNDLCSSFEFFADNLSIEWESIITANGNRYLGTSQCGSSSNAGQYIESCGEIITIHTHNHPAGTPAPGKGDINMVKKEPF